MEQLTVETWGNRIDLRLSQQFVYSRNFFHRLLEAGVITVKNKQRDSFVPKKSYTVQTDDQITIASFLRYLDGGILDETPAWDIDIRHETDDYVILRKPKGVLSHPTSIWNVNVPSVVGGVYHHYKKSNQALPTGSASFIRAGLVHRLDMDTDGFMIIAKTERWLAHFKALFHDKSNQPTKEAKEAVPLKKSYRADCIITPEGSRFLNEIENHLPHYIEQVVIPKVPYTVPKMGISKIVAITPTSEDRVIIEIEILTGRTHQIRYHLSQAGLPIYADPLYGTEITGMITQLTAWKLEFQDLDGAMKYFVKA
jgi:23S rRNA-/tRNA-specific pseudouridylate synthase